MAFTSDSFTDTNGVALPGHVGETGASWTKHSLSAAASAAAITTNRAYYSGPDTAGSIYLYASGVPATAEYDATGTIYVNGTNNAVAGVFVRMNTSNGDHYGVNCLPEAAGTQRFELYKRVANVVTVLGTYNLAMAVGDSHTVTLQVRNSGTTLTVLIDGVSRITSTDAVITAAGRAGIRLYSNSNSTTGVHIDSLSASDPAADYRAKVMALSPTAYWRLGDAPPAPAAPVSIDDGIIYFDDALDAPWSNTSPATSLVNLVDQNPSSQAEQRGQSINHILWTTTAGGALLRFHHATGLDTSPYNYLEFTICKSGSPAAGIQVLLNNPAGAQVGGTYTLATVPTAGMGDPSRVVLSLLNDLLLPVGTVVGDVVIRDNTGGARSFATYLDDLWFSRIRPVSHPGIPDQAENSFRVANYVPNHAPLYIVPASGAYSFLGSNFREFYRFVDGDCSGTTPEILDWATRKWGFAGLAPPTFGANVNGPSNTSVFNLPDLGKALAIQETDWTQFRTGDWSTAPNDRTQTVRSGVSTRVSLGISQVRNDGTAAWGGHLYARRSTALAMDIAFAVIRYHLSGDSYTDSQTFQTRGNLRRSVNAWFSGSGAVSGQPSLDGANSTYTCHILGGVSNQDSVDYGSGYYGRKAWLDLPQTDPNSWRSLYGSGGAVI